MNDIDDLKRRILEMRREVPKERSLLVGISGIDASGKGYVAGKLVESLANELKVAVINADGWLNLPHVRFCNIGLGEHFYHYALRLDEMFERLVLPLKHCRSVRATADLAEETATEFRPHEYTFDDIDLILLEGIFLFKKPFAAHFDLKIWIDCRFETAVKRAICRSQEKLPPRDTLTAYKQIYFPAQRIHSDYDDPMGLADIVFDNDTRF